MFNLLLSQAKRNEDLKLRVVDEKIKDTELESMSFYDKINSQVRGDFDSAERLVEIIATTLLTTLKKELVHEFEAEDVEVLLRELGPFHISQLSALERAVVGPLGEGNFKERPRVLLVGSVVIG